MSQKHNDLKHNIISKWWVILPLLYSIACAIYIITLTPDFPIKDETYFYPEVINFSEALHSKNFSYFQDYDLPQPPLYIIFTSFIYDLGARIISLRLLNLVYSFLTLVVFFHLLNILFKGEKFKCLIPLSVLILTNPYYFLVSVHFYTDIPYLLFVSAALHSFFDKKNKPLYFLATLAPLIRQFGVFIASGIFLNNLINFKKKKNISSLVLPIICLVPLLLLFIYWDRFIPSTRLAFKVAGLRKSLGFIIINYAVYYLSVLGFYLSPIWLLNIKKVVKNKFFLIGATLSLFLYITFPPIKNFLHGVPLGLYQRLAIYLFSDYFHFPLAFFCMLFGGYCGVFITSSYVPIIIKIWITLLLGAATLSPMSWDKYTIDLQFLTVLGYLFWKIRPEKNLINSSNN